MHDPRRERKQACRQVTLVVMALFVMGLVFSSVNAAEPALFDQVGLLLEQRCVRCHGAETHEAGFSLATAEAALAGGDSGESIVPGHPDESMLLDMVGGDSPAMPKRGAKLNSAQVALLRTWIAEGAPWPKGRTLRDRQFEIDTWWSLQPLKTPPVPEVAAEQRAWVRNPIDAFVLAKLAQVHLTPSPEADRRTLIRRLTYDLHGLPPTPEEVQAFVHDEQPLAYERLVDRLLASPRYGEAWARHWLDVVHYGDTHGYDKDKRRPNAWPYRDYVIASFNSDKPYPRFIEEQLAGDVLYPDDPQATIATGFIAAGPWDYVGQVELREGTVDKQITRLLDRDDMVTNTMTTFCSATVHCARCHNHPFDAFKQDDYYRLQAVFAGVDRGDRPFESPELHRQRTDLVAKQNAAAARQKDLEAKIAALASPELTRFDAELATVDQQIKALPGLFELAAKPVDSPTNGYHSAISATADVTKWVEVDLGAVLPVERIELVPARPTDFPDSPGFGFPVRFSVLASDEPTFAHPAVLADFTHDDFASPRDLPVIVDGRQVHARWIRVVATRLWQRTGDYVFALGELCIESAGANVALGKPVTALDSIEGGRWGARNLVDGYTSRHQLPDLHHGPAAELLDRRSALVAQRTLAEKARQTELQRLVPANVSHDLEQAQKDLAEASRMLGALPPPGHVYGITPVAAREIQVLHRGDVTKPIKPVQAGALACLPGMPAEFKLDDAASEGARRAALARWIASRDNVLTWRSIVNRVWQYHFGQGIVDSASDFGHMGATPSHPELLDWLAANFRDSGGSLKSLHRLLVTSSAYRQAVTANEAAASRDSSNRLLWRMNRRRLSAESVRDGVLLVAGDLDLTMGGPGFDLFGFEDDHSPRYLYEQVNFDDARTRRRSIYRTVVRSVPDPFMETLDCADPSQNVPLRNETITPLQALALLNNPFMVRESQRFAERVSKTEPDLGRQIDLACRLAYGRDPSPDERKLLLHFARQHGLANTCRLIVNSNEFVFVD